MRVRELIELLEAEPEDAWVRAEFQHPDWDVPAEIDVEEVVRSVSGAAVYLRGEQL
jgi:hypothetical protein